MSELAIQHYLRALQGPELAPEEAIEALTNEYAIEVHPCPALGVATFNYHQILSPMREQISRECRGLILELGTWNVVCRSFFKFFNQGETAGDDIEADLDWPNASFYTKLDGSLALFYHWRGEWRCGTRGNADASGCVGSMGMTFRDLIEMTIQDMIERKRSFRLIRSAAWEHFTAQLDPDHYYAFELTAPENRVVCKYDERTLTLIGVWDRLTLAEEPVAKHRCRLYPHVEPLPILDLATAQAMLEQAEWWAEEGYVVCDPAFRRVKVKSSAYRLAAHALVSTTSDRAKLSLILAGKMDDALPYLPDPQKPRVEQLTKALADIAAAVETDWQAWKDIPDRKEYAARATSRVWKHMLFARRNFGMMPLEYLAKQTPKAALETLMNAGFLDSICEEEAAWNSKEGTSRVLRVLVATPSC